MSAPTTHDFTRRYWGHDYSILKVIKNGQKLWACVFSPMRLREGDFLVLANGDSTTRYQVTGDIDRPLDPGDQYFVPLKFAPRTASAS